MSDAPQPIPVIVGPTAGGKTSLSIGLAEALGGSRCAEIISADAFQVYRDMDIGTAKPTIDERHGIAHHLIDIRDPTESFSVSDWLALAEPLIDDIRGRDRVPIVVGGTHFYVKAFLEGLFESPDPDPELRARLTAMDPTERRSELERVDPEAAARIHPNDVRRTVRALEVHTQTGQPISARQTQWDAGRVRPDCVLIGLSWETDEGSRRINERVRRMMQDGLLEEVRRLLESERLGEQAAQALGYKQLIAHLRGTCDLETAVERIKIETRRFAKNQRTWLRRLRQTPGSCWIEACQLDEAARCRSAIEAIRGASPA